MRKIGILASVAIVVTLAACSAIPRPGPVSNRAVPEPVKSVDLQRYMGRWYEQFRYEASFQKGFVACCRFDGHRDKFIQAIVIHTAHHLTRSPHNARWPGNSAYEQGESTARLLRRSRRSNAPKRLLAPEAQPKAR
jgi:lipocalin